MDVLSGPRGAVRITRALRVPFGIVGFASGVGATGVVIGLVGLASEYGERLQRTTGGLVR